MTESTPNHRMNSKPEMAVVSACADILPWCSSCHLGNPAPCLLFSHFPYTSLLFPRIHSPYPPPPRPTAVADLICKDSIQNNSVTEISTSNGTVIGTGCQKGMLLWKSVASHLNHTSTGVLFEGQDWMQRPVI